MPDVSATVASSDPPSPSPPPPPASAPASRVSLSSLGPNRSGGETVSAPASFFPRELMDLHRSVGSVSPSPMGSNRSVGWSGSSSPMGLYPPVVETSVNSSMGPHRPVGETHTLAGSAHPSFPMGPHRSVGEAGPSSPMGPSRPVVESGVDSSMDPHRSVGELHMRAPIVPPLMNPQWFVGGGAHVGFPPTSASAPQPPHAHPLFSGGASPPEMISASSERSSQQAVNADTWSLLAMLANPALGPNTPQSVC